MTRGVPIDRDQLVRLRRKGLSIADLAAHFGTTVKSTEAALHRVGMSDRRYRPERRAIPMQEPAKPAAPLHTYATAQELVAQGMSQRAALQQMHRRRA
jgi:hypothetical protein